MHVQLPELNLEADVVIPLTRPQALKVMRMETSEEKQEFVGKLCQRTPALQRLIHEALQRVVNETGWTPPKNDEGK
jgi:hypothetical protein